MKKLILIAIAMLVSFCCAPVFANGAVPPEQVGSVQIEGSSFIAIYAKDGAFANPDNCGQSNALVIPLSDAAAQSKMAMAMSALAGQMDLSSYVTGCHSTPWGYTLPKVYTLRVFK